MKTKRKQVLGWLCSILFLMIFLRGIGSSEPQEIGKLVDKSNWQEYESLLSPAQLRAAQKGEWTFQTGNFRSPYKHWDRFLTASEKNAGKYDVDRTGLFVDKGTGKYPEHNVYGMPFPQIDPKDPNAGVKIMWNFKFVMYRFMGRNDFDVYTRWIGKTGKEDRYGNNTQWNINYQGRAPGQEIKKNPDSFLYQDLAAILEPMDIRGVNQMTWEYWDERDSTVYSYLPVIRRVRRGTGAQRSDPFMGSDAWWDGKDGFAGKNQSFAWKLVGEKMHLAAMDSLEKRVLEETPEGILRVTYPPRKFGHDTPGWKGAPWAITNAYWVPRPVWVVEGMPQDPYYAWGKHIFWIDKENYFILNKEVFDKAGEFQHWHQYTWGFGEAPSGNNIIGQINILLALDTKSNHATSTIRRETHTFMPISKIAPRFFTMANFLQLSK